MEIYKSDKKGLFIVRDGDLFDTYTPSRFDRSRANNLPDNIFEEMEKVWTDKVIEEWELSQESTQEDNMPEPPQEPTQQQIDDLRMAQHETNMLLMQLISGGVE